MNTVSTGAPAPLYRKLTILVPDLEWDRPGLSP